MPREPITNIPQSLTSFTAECLVVRDNCVASKQASKQASKVYNRENSSSESPAGFICRGMFPHGR